MEAKGIGQVVSMRGGRWCGREKEITNVATHIYWRVCRPSLQADHEMFLPVLRCQEPSV
jgi:hypothetical protein